MIHKHFAAEFLMLLQVFIEISTLSYLVKLEVEIVDTSTFSTEFLDAASGFCWYFNILLFGKAWGGVCWYINIFHWISWRCLRFMLIYQHTNLVKRAVEFVDTSTFSTAIYEIWTNIWRKWPYNLYFCWGFLLLTCDLGILTRDFKLLTATFPLKRVKRFYVFILDGLWMCYESAPSLPMAVMYIDWLQVRCYI